MDNDDDEDDAEEDEEEDEEDDFVWVMHSLAHAITKAGMGCSKRSRATDRNRLSINGSLDSGQYTADVLYAGCGVVELKGDVVAVGGRAQCARMPTVFQVRAVARSIVSSTSRRTVVSFCQRTRVLGLSCQGPVTGAVTGASPAPAPAAAAAAVAAVAAGAAIDADDEEEAAAVCEEGEGVGVGGE